MGPWTWLICLRRRHRFEKKRREEGLAPTEQGMPTAEEQLAGRTGEGRPEAGGKQGRGVTAARSALPGGDGPVHRPLLRGWERSLLSSPLQSRSLHGGHPASLCLSCCSPTLHCLPVPSWLCLSPRPYPSLSGTWSEAFRPGVGMPVVGEAPSPGRRPLRHPHKAARRGSAS